MHGVEMQAKLIEWLRRYLPLEIAATAFALLGGLGAATLTANGAIIAYAATWFENVGFYGVALWREVRGRLNGAPLTVAAVTPTLAPSGRALLLEFGPAEVLDSFVIRPACMYALPKLTGSLTLGLIFGKFMADLAFYGLAIVAYEWLKRRR
jgi:hypothetical protein